jgi:hypothetical protein
MKECEGCRLLIEWNTPRKQWEEVTSGKKHDCKNKDKVKQIIRDKNRNSHAIDPNVRFIEGLTVCKKCHARYSLQLPRCPNCKEQFIKSLFIEKK